MLKRAFNIEVIGKREQPKMWRKQVKEEIEKLRLKTEGDFNRAKWSYSFTSSTWTLLSQISVSSDHNQEKKWKNIPRLKKKCLKI